MKKLFLIILIAFEMFSNKGTSQITFQKKYGTSNNGAILGANDISILQTYDGGYCVAGTISANNGDAYLMKLNSMGDTLWTKTFGGNFDEFIFSLEQTSDSGFVLAGYTRSFSMGNSDAYVIRTNANGTLLWSKNYGGFDWEYFTSIRQISSNRLIACGNTSTFGSGTGDIYLVEMDLSGNIVWTKTLGGTGLDGGNSIQKTFDNGFIITGSTSSFTATSGRIYLVKTDSSGNSMWGKIFGGVLGEAGFCVRQCADSGFIVTGYTNSFGAGGQDAFLLKTNINGNLQWMKTYGGVWEDMGYSVEQTDDGGFIFTGRTQSFGPDSGIARNIYLVKTTAMGDTLWTRTYGSVINNGYSVKQVNDGGYIIASSPTRMNVIRTDSLGHTAGCNEYTTNTIINSVSPIILTGVNTSSGGSANSAATLTRYTSITVNTECMSTGIENMVAESNKTNIYPNPFANQINIATGNNELSEVIVYDIASRKLLQQNFTSTITLNTEQLAKGIYIYEVRNKNGVIKKGKVIKE
jgi:hypothetical protein